MKVIVLGAGVTGVATAWYLNKSGHEVTVLERQGAAGMESGNSRQLGTGNKSSGTAGSAAGSGASSAAGSGGMGGGATGGTMR